MFTKLKLLLLQTEGNQPLESVNPLTPNDLQRLRAVSLLNTKIPVKICVKNQQIQQLFILMKCTVQEAKSPVKLS
jgi:hypothetical protein